MLSIKTSLNQHCCKSDVFCSIIQQIKIFANFISVKLSSLLNTFYTEVLQKGHQKTWNQTSNEIKWLLGGKGVIYSRWKSSTSTAFFLLYFSSLTYLDYQGLRMWFQILIFVYQSKDVASSIRLTIWLVAQSGCNL